MSKDSLKQALIEAYAQGTVAEFHEFEAFTHGTGIWGEQYKAPFVESHITHALAPARNTPVAVKLTISAGTPAKTVLALLEEITHRVRHEIDSAADTAFRQYHRLDGDFDEVPF